MWAYLIAFLFVIVGLIGAVLGGGIFTIVLVPIGLIVGGGAALFGMWGRAAQGSGGAETHETHTADQPLPHELPGDSGHAPTSPEALADSRRAQQ
jgi:hypothetical protein